MNISTISVPLATAELNDTPTYLKQRQDGLWEETRFHFKPGDRVRTTRGPYEGQEVVIDTLVGVTQSDDGYWNGEVGYNVILEDKRCITVQWDRVTKIP